MAKKTKAAMQGRQCHYTNLKDTQHITLVKRVNWCGAVENSSTKISVQPFGSSLAFFRWRRLISPCMAELMNCPVLSPGFFTSSIPSMISCAIRAVTDCDFAFFEPVAMPTFSKGECKTLYTKVYFLEVLTCKTPIAYCVSYTLFGLRCVNSEARQCSNTNRASDQSRYGD